MRKIKSKVLGALIKNMMGKHESGEAKKPEPKCAECGKESCDCEGKEASEDESEGKGSISIIIAHGKAKKG